MSRYKQEDLNNGVVTGFLEDKVQAWHQAGINPDTLFDLGRAFFGPVPHEVAERLLGWQPVIITPQVITDWVMGDNGEELVEFALPDRLSQFIANPITKNIVNVAGSGYNADLHITMREAIGAAMDAECDIASVVMLGDGAHMGMSFRARDTIVLGGEWGGAVPYVGFNSSLTGAIATQMDTGTTLRVCDNTMEWAAMQAKRSLKVKRTRFSTNKITASNVREALEISFAGTEELVKELEAMANISVDVSQISQVLQLWKPIPEEDGRGKTMATNQHESFIEELIGRRNPFGMTVAGMLQAHNTWAHWSQSAKGLDQSATGRLDRMAKRTATGEVRGDDAQFMEIMAGVFPELALIGA